MIKNLRISCIGTVIQRCIFQFNASVQCIKHFYRKWRNNIIIILGPLQQRPKAKQNKKTKKLDSANQ